MPAPPACRRMVVLGHSQLTDDLGCWHVSLTHGYDLLFGTFINTVSYPEITARRSSRYRRPLVPRSVGVQCPVATYPPERVWPPSHALVLSGPGRQRGPRPGRLVVVRGAERQVDGQSPVDNPCWCLASRTAWRRGEFSRCRTYFSRLRIWWSYRRVCRLWFMAAH